MPAPQHTVQQHEHAHEPRKLLVAYVGGCQGVRLDDEGALYRQLTKAAHGMRPRDLLIEIFRSICRTVGIRCILAISDEARHHNSRYSRTWIRHDPVVGDYDDIWTDRGGMRRGDGFFAVPVQTRRRSAEEVPAKKRTIYAARYRMLDSIDAAIQARCAGAIDYKTHPYLGKTSLPDAIGADVSGVRSGGER